MEEKGEGGSERWRRRGRGGVKGEGGGGGMKGRGGGVKRRGGEE